MYSTLPPPSREVVFGERESLVIHGRKDKDLPTIDDVASTECPVRNRQLLLVYISWKSQSRIVCLSNIWEFSPLQVAVSANNGSLLKTR